MASWANQTAVGARGGRGRRGMQNIFVLGENQLRGKVHFEMDNGILCRITFQDIGYEPRV